MKISCNSFSHSSNRSCAHFQTATVRQANLFYFFRPMFVVPSIIMKLQKCVRSSNIGPYFYTLREKNLHSFIYFFPLAYSFIIICCRLSIFILCHTPNSCELITIDPHKMNTNRDCDVKTCVKTIKSLNIDKRRTHWQLLRRSYTVKPVYL